MFKIYKAKWILPGKGKVIENSAILVEDSIILNIIRQEELNQSLIYDAEVIDYGRAIITPGFINLHTHLQFTNLSLPHPLTPSPGRGSSYCVGASPLQQTPIIQSLSLSKSVLNSKNSSCFSDWIIELIKQYSHLTSKEKIKSLKNGIKEAVLSGTTCVAQISREPEFLDIFKDANIRTYLFWETFSNSEQSSNKEFQELKEKFNNYNFNNSGLIKFGISPHSVYNVHPTLWKKITDFSTKNDILVHTHFAESEDEINWLKYGHSDIDLIHKFVGWNKIYPFKSNLTPLNYLKELGVLNLRENLILAHCNQLENNELQDLSKYNINIAHCPRSNLMLHKKTINLEEAKLNRIGIGTDSQFSNVDLSIFNEAKYIKSNTSLDLLKLLDMLTIDAAKILKIDKETGSLEIGKKADFLVFQLENTESFLDLFNKIAPDNVYSDGKSLVKDGIYINASRS